MSRLRRLKEDRKKDRIKAASCGLSLALAIGMSQGLGTYALFTDTEDLKSDLAISTGDVDVYVESIDGSDLKNIMPGDIITHTFTIINKGTLNQNIILKLSKIPQAIIESISIDFGIRPEGDVEGTGYVVENTEVGQNVASIDNLNLQGEIALIDKNDTNDLFILQPGQQITANLSIKVIEMTPEKHEALQGITQEIDIAIKASQINKDNDIVENGFYDLEILETTFTIGEYIENIISGNDIKVSANGSNLTEVDVTINYIEELKYNGTIKPSAITIVEGAGAFAKSTIPTNLNNPQKFVISIVNKNLIDDKDFGAGNTIKLKFIYPDGKNTVEKIFEFDFRDVQKISGNLKLQAKFKEVEIEKPSQPGSIESDQPGVTLPEYPDTEGPDEPGVTLPEYPDLEQPSQPGVTLPEYPDIEEPSEPGVTLPEQPEIEEPSQPGVTLPEEPDAIEPPKQDEIVGE